jgi:hypothetical protein
MPTSPRIRLGQLVSTLMWAVGLTVVLALTISSAQAAAQTAGAKPAAKPARPGKPVKPQKSFDELAGEAANLPTLGALRWAADGCDKLTNDLYRRQCQGVRAHATGAARAASYRVLGDGKAIWVGQFDDKKKTLPIEIFGCLACEGDDAFVIAGQGDGKIEGGTLRGPSLAKVQKAFPDAEAAAAWTKDVAPRLRLQLVVLAPQADNRVAVAGKNGFKVGVAGHRLWDPCDGSVVSAEPPAETGPRDEVLCGTRKTATVEPPVDAGPRLPDTLSVAAVKKALGPAEAAVMNDCYGNLGVAGRADLVIHIASDGTVKKVVVKGKFADTPTGECIIEKVKTTTFPPFKSASMSIGYPIILR